MGIYDTASGAWLTPNIGDTRVYKRGSKTFEKTRGEDQGLIVRVRRVYNNMPV